MILRIDSDPRAALGSARDQGRRPTCLAFAASDAHRQARRHPAPFCVAWLHYHAIAGSSGIVEDGETILGVDRGEPVDPARGHAAVAVGAGRYEGEPVTLLRNSWGAAWAAKGHAWAYDCYLEPRLIGAFTVR